MMVLPERFAPWYGESMCPLPNGVTKVEVILRDGSIVRTDPSFWTWTHSDEPCDILGYKILEVKGLPS